MEVLKKQYIIDDKGDKRAVILSIEQYEQLMKDIHDLAVVAERREEEAISFGEMSDYVNYLALRDGNLPAMELKVFIDN